MTVETNVESAEGVVWKWLPVVFIPVVAGVFTLFVLPGWMVGFDGTSYLAEASSILEFGTYTAPDGSAITFRGPGYPLWLSVGWLVGADSADVAIFVSRIAGLLIVVAAAAIVFLLTKRVLAAVVTGLLVAAQPFLVLGGAVDFFPDSVAVLCVVVTIALLAGARDRPDPFVLSGCAGIFAALAFMTKESHVLVLAAAVLWVFTLAEPLRLRLEIVGVFGLSFSLAALPWMLFGMEHTGALPGVLAPYDGVQGWVLLAAMFLVPIGLVLGGRFAADVRWRLPVWVPSVAVVLIILGITTRFRGGSYWLEVPGSIMDRVTIESFRGSTWLALVVLLGLGLFSLWTVRRDPTGQLVASVAVGGVALLVFTGFAATSPRNAILLPVALAVGVGLFIAAQPSSALLLGAVAGLCGVVVFGGVVAVQRIEEVWDFERLTYESTATTDAASWIDANTDAASFAGSPAAFQSVWRLGIDHERVALTPILVNQLNNTDPAEPTFSQIYGWIGKPFVAARGDEALLYSYNRKEVSAMFLDDIDAMLATWDYLVLAGNTRYPALPTDGGILALVLEEHGAVEPVFVSHHEGAQWVAVVKPIGRIDTVAGPTGRFMLVPEVGGPYARTYGLTGYAHSVETLLAAWQEALVR